MVFQLLIFTRCKCAHPQLCLKLQNRQAAHPSQNRREKRRNENSPRVPKSGFCGLGCYAIAGIFHRNCGKYEENCGSNSGLIAWILFFPVIDYPFFTAYEKGVPFVIYGFFYFHVYRAIIKKRYVHKN